MKAETRLAMPEDFVAVGATAMHGTLRGLALVLDGRTVGVASIRYTRRGSPITASVDVLPEARRQPVTFHRWALKGLVIARGLGLRYMTAVADKSVPRADAWLKRLGFDYVGESEAGGVWRCKLS